MVTKRVFDFTAALVGLLVFFPFLILIAILIKLDSPGPIFFRQERMRLGFRSFRLFKFRSMRVDAPATGPAITAGGDSRVTRVGRWLRDTKLDELPQLINVVLGEMSLVGPRPEVRKYVEMFRRDYEDILKVRPGITDYAAIAFRDEESVLARFENPEEGYVREVLPRKILLYRQYLARRSFWIDLRIIFLTVVRITG